jgi:hypothetical protein
MEVYFMAISYILGSFGILYGHLVHFTQLLQEKSGNPWGVPHQLCSFVLQSEASFKIRMKLTPRGEVPRFTPPLL